MNDTPTPIPAIGFDPRQDNPLVLSDYFGSAMLVALDKSFRDNASNLLTRVNRLMRQFGHNRRVVRGFSPTPIPDADTNPDWLHLVLSNLGRHGSAEAVDLADPEGDLDQWLLDNQKFLESCGLWVEHPATTRGHCHLQSVPPKGGSRRRVFYP
jgi:hypothetical protein